MNNLFTDKTLLIWNYSDFDKREHKNLRVNLGYDYASKVCFSPDDKALLLNKHEENSIEVYKLNKKPDGSPLSVTPALTFPQVRYSRNYLIPVQMILGVNYRFITSREFNMTTLQYLQYTSV